MLFTAKNKDVLISALLIIKSIFHLLKKGNEKAGWMQIDDLKIAKPKKWDKKWRLVIFDIAQIEKIYREELFRGKLKKLGFLSLKAFGFTRLTAVRKLNY